MQTYKIETARLLEDENLREFRVLLGRIFINRDSCKNPGKSTVVISSETRNLLYAREYKIPNINSE